MASIVLSAAGSALGASIPFAGPAIGATIGRTIGGSLGSVVDNAIFGSPSRNNEGARLGDLSVQVSTYGKIIPNLYGTMRLAGNVIWATSIKETATITTSTSGGGKGIGGGVKTNSTNFSYSISLAIAICEGEIAEIQRVWADAKQLDLSAGIYRIYKGDEVQFPDSFIESFQGIGKTPAYRGTAYVVIEDFPLADFGNRIPNFTFEIKKPTIHPDFGGQAVEDMIESMVMIPGAGEFVYDSVAQSKITGASAGNIWAQTGAKQSINIHTPFAKANSLVSLDNLEKTCPNLKWIGVVATWFGDNLNAGICTIFPAVEYQNNAITEPDTWQVGSFTRATAAQITMENGTPRYGGTPSDASLIHYINELKNRGYKVFFMPMFFMDILNKPWRGRVTGTASDVSSFFTKTGGYNDFIEHYANLLKDKVDAFSIGSELIGLTKITEVTGVYPAVDQLVALAGNVKTIMGINTKITYAADWSEYHHTDGGWYNMDILWATPNIDFIGIDAYFPLTDEPQNGYNVQKIIDGWDSGEGYDFYYTDTDRTITATLSPAFAWKNIDYFWNNYHINPDNNTTAWIPQSKKIWFTEYGFPSVDGCSNQPNVFYDETSSESFFPRFSRGIVDFMAQRTAITATESRWKNSSMVEQKFLWTWDARPYPYYPDLNNIWADGAVWKTGHWVTGKLGLSSLAAIIADLCNKAGLTPSQYDVSRLLNRVDGYIITSSKPIRNAIEELMSAYFFDAVETDGIIKFIPRGGDAVMNITSDELIRQNNELLNITRVGEFELPKEIDLIHLSKANNYQPNTAIARRFNSISEDKISFNLPLVLNNSEAHSIADKILYLSWLSRIHYSFMLNADYITLEPADIINITSNNFTYKIRITNITSDRGMLKINGTQEDANIYQKTPDINENGTSEVFTPPAKTNLELLDIPALPSDDVAYLRFAITGEGMNWHGSVIYRSDDMGANYGLVTSTIQPSIIGRTINILGDFTAGNIFDKSNKLQIALMNGGEIASINRTAILSGANSAVIGTEIVQFENAIEISTGIYEISTLLRGRLGTEWAISSHIAGERFILLDSNILKKRISPDMINLPRKYKAVTIGETLGSTIEEDFNYTAIALKPYSPVHIKGTRDSSNNLTISWIRRTRNGGAWRDLVDISLSEQTEKYEVDILNTGDIIRTISSTISNIIYSAADQITDFGSVQTNIAVNIYQISNNIGRGYVSNAVV